METSLLVAFGLVLIYAVVASKAIIKQYKRGNKHKGI
jgi:hypothetical protein